MDVKGTAVWSRREQNLCVHVCLCVSLVVARTEGTEGAEGTEGKHIGCTA